MLIRLCTFSGCFDVITPELSSCVAETICLQGLKYYCLALSRKKIANPCTGQKVPKTPTRGHPRSDMDPRKSPSYMRMKKNTQVFNEYLDAFLAEKAERSILPKNNPMLPENTI